LFLKKGGGKELLLFRGVDAIVRCLKCGRCFGINFEPPEPPKVIIEHVRHCHCELFLALTGSAATGVIRVAQVWAADEMPGATAPLYITDNGDDDRGLKLGVRLVLLPDERRRPFLSKMLLGHYAGIADDNDFLTMLPWALRQ
jgi:hypothetical protein